MLRCIVEKKRKECWNDAIPSSGVSPTCVHVAVELRAVVSQYATSRKRAHHCIRIKLQSELYLAFPHAHSQQTNNHDDEKLRGTKGKQTQRWKTMRVLLHLPTRPVTARHVPRRSLPANYVSATPGLRLGLLLRCKRPRYVSFVHQSRRLWPSPGCGLLG